jgi:hypothetical protein
LTATWTSYNRCCRRATPIATGRGSTASPNITALPIPAAINGIISTGTAAAPMNQSNCCRSSGLPERHRLTRLATISRSATAMSASAASASTSVLSAGNDAGASGLSTPVSRSSSRVGASSVVAA